MSLFIRIVLVTGWVCSSIQFVYGNEDELAGVLKLRASRVEGKLASEASATYYSDTRSSVAREWVEVRGLPPFLLQEMLDSKSIGQWITLRTRSDPSSVPMFGRHEVEAGRVLFFPQFQLQPGIHYYVHLIDTRSADGKTAVFSFSIPKKELKPETYLKHVFPSSNQLPANLLKFYIHFSQPMSVGKVYTHIRLLESSGRSLELPFLEIGEELWDPQSRRLTLLFDPGRIKRGLKPNRDTGAPLTEGESYTLHVSRKFLDAKGRPLVEDFSRTFTVLPPDHIAPNPYNWELSKPKSYTKQAVAVTFPESLDEALLQRVVSIVDEKGQEITGTIAVTDQETQWAFKPEKPWLPGSYRLRARTILEDLAGNSIARPFEVDASRPPEGYPETQYVYLPFKVE